MENIFIKPDSLPGGDGWAKACALATSKAAKEALRCDTNAFFGLCQVALLLMVYSFILFNASQLISDGSELLLLVPSLRNIVGSVVLPILGAVPDGAIIFFSGMGPNAQEEVAVGIGALAGSTIMLTTLPWMLSVIGGRVNVNSDGSMNYARPANFRGSWTKLMPPGYFSPTKTGIECSSVVAKAGRTLIFTSITYLIIQVPAIYYGTYRYVDDTPENTAYAAEKERYIALGAGILAFIFFALYLVEQVVQKESKATPMETVVGAVQQKAIAAGKISITAAFFDELLKASEKVVNESTSLVSSKNQSRLDMLLSSFFKEVDEDRNGRIDKAEFELLMTHMGEKHSMKELSAYFDDIDTDKNGSIDYREFSEAVPKYIVGNKSRFQERQLRRTISRQEDVDVHPQEEDDVEEVPEDLKDQDPAKQLAKIQTRSFSMMAIGTVLVLIFSDPMCAVLADFGNRIGVPPFYISFVLAPLASNASELLASYNYSKMKSIRTITISFSTLLGAGIMNNTFCLGIFLLLIFLKGLAWEFSAETFAILIVEIIMYFFSQKKRHTVLDGFLVFSLYPLSLCLVAFLENVLGFD